MAATPRGSIPTASSTHRLRRGLPGYLILFAPHAFAPQRQYLPRSRLRHWCSSRYLRISPLHREFRDPLKYSSTAVSDALPWLSRGISHPTCNAAYVRFTPNNSEQRLHPSYYRGCWHEVSRCLLRRYRHAVRYERPAVRPSPQSFTTRRPSSLTRRGWIRLAPIVQYSPLLPPVGVWAVSQSQCG